MKRMKRKIIMLLSLLLFLSQINLHKINAMTSGDILEIYGEYHLEEYDIPKLKSENEKLKKDIKRLLNIVQKKKLYNKAITKGMNYYQDIQLDLEKQIRKLQKRLNYASQQLNLKKDAPFEEIIRWEIWYGEQKDSLNTLITDFDYLKNSIPFKAESTQKEIDKIEKKHKTIRDNKLDIKYSFKYPEVCEGKVPKFPLIGVKEEISSKFGERNLPIDGASVNHKGIDYKAPEGTPVRNVLEGSVMDAGYNDSLGYFVKVNNFFGTVTLYAHMSQLYVTRGNWVKDGDILGLSGSTGISTGPHLHFAIYVNKKARNPIKLFTKPEDYKKKGGYSD